MNCASCSALAVAICIRCGRRLCRDHLDVATCKGGCAPDVTATPGAWWTKALTEADLEAARAEGALAERRECYKLVRGSHNVHVAAARIKARGGLDA